MRILEGDPEPADPPLRRRVRGWLWTAVERAARAPRAAVAFFVVSFLLLLAATWGFVQLASSILEGETRRFDLAVLRRLAALATPALDQVAIEVTALGDTKVLAMVLLVSSALLWVTRHRYSVLLLWLAIAGSIVLGRVLKAAFDRPRPAMAEWRTDYTVDSASFPSGHALETMVAYVALAYLIARLQASARLRWLTLAIGGVAVILIGLSRIYLGVHHPSDVVAGYAVGLAWVTLCALGVEGLRFVRDGRVWMERDPRGSRPAEGST